MKIAVQQLRGHEQLCTLHPFSFANLFLVKKKTEVGKIEGEREVQQACCCCVCEKICTTVAAAQFEIYAVLCVRQQQQFIDA